MRTLLRVHQWLYQMSRGWIGHHILGVPCLLLETIGTRSGLRRVAALVYLREGDAVILVGSNGGSDQAPGWYRNLESNHEVKIRIGHRRHVGRAEIVNVTDEHYSRLWNTLNAMNKGRYDRYQSLTTRRIPLVRVHLT